MIPVAVVGAAPRAGVHLTRVAEAVAACLEDRTTVRRVTAGPAAPPSGLGEAGWRAALTAPVDDAEAVRTAGVVVLSVGDAELVPLARAFAAAAMVREGQRWLHVSRGHGIAALQPLELAGADVAACAPVLPVSTTRDEPGGDVSDEGAPRLAGAPWLVSTRAPDTRWPAEFVRELGGEPVVVPDAARARADAALTLASAGVATVAALARDLLVGAGVADPERLLEGLGPVVSAGARGGGAAVGPPVATGEHDRIARQFEDLGVALPEALEAYAAVLRLAVGYARRAGMPAEDARALLRLLGRVDGLDSQPPSP